MHNHYLLCAAVQKWLSSKPCQFVKKYFFSIKLLPAHLQYVCNISATCWNPRKALSRIDFTKYALSIIIYYVLSSENGSVKNPAVCPKKYFFSIKLLHAHLQYVCNISEKPWKDPMKALKGVDFTKYVLWVIIQQSYQKNCRGIILAILTLQPLFSYHVQCQMVKVWCNFDRNHLSLFNCIPQNMSHVTRKPAYAICEQQRCRSACASAQSDHRLFVRCLDSIIPLLAIATISRL